MKISVVSAEAVLTLFTNKTWISGRGHRSVTSLNGSGGGRTKSSKSRRERGEDRGTPYDTGSSTNLNSRGSRRHHRNNHGSSGSSSSNMGGNVSSKFGELQGTFLSIRPVLNNLIYTLRQSNFI